jgi:hypothetical protein
MGPRCDDEALMIRQMPTQSWLCVPKTLRTHLSLEKDAPVSRAVERAGRILCRPVLAKAVDDDASAQSHLQRLIDHAVGSR